MTFAIKAEGLGKCYLIGHQRKEAYGTLRDSFVYGAKSLVNRVLHPNIASSGSEVEEFWALRDVSFEIQPGDRVGIIGRNGAGKSTLLKILSRITEPTTGRFITRGRVASLLEVGTGFHPELSGRENIFLNGAILGMSKVDVQRQFDAIVDFSGIEKFLDTPVKRYSSGMYVRLAFAVAAHLDPDILIVDEVLAVGDTDFQKKCLGKMEEAGNDGRTVVFVSHNMGAVKSLCLSGIVMKAGKFESNSPILDAIEKYTASNELPNTNSMEYQSICGSVLLKQPYWIDNKSRRRNTFISGETFAMRFELNILQPMRNLVFGVALDTSTGTRVLTAHSIDDKNYNQSSLPTGKATIDCELSIPNLASGYYRANFGIRNENNKNLITDPQPIPLHIENPHVMDGNSGILCCSGKWSNHG